MGGGVVQLLQAPGVVHGGRQGVVSTAEKNFSVRCNDVSPKGYQTRFKVVASHNTSRKPRIPVQKVPSVATTAGARLRNRHFGKCENRHKRRHVASLAEGIAESDASVDASAYEYGAPSLTAEPLELTSDIYFTEAGIEVVRSLEEAENELLKVVSGRTQGASPPVDWEHELDHISLPGQPGSLPGGAYFVSDTLNENAPSWSPAEFLQAESDAEGAVITLQSVLEVKLAEEQSIGWQPHLLNNLDEATSAVAAAVMVAEVADALKLVSEPTLLEPTLSVPLVDWATGEEDLEKESTDIPSSVQTQEVGVESKNVLEQLKEIIAFAGPALGIWLSGPLMSLIDTSVIGTSSSLELAALGPGTIFCDQSCYVFMFLSVATSYLIATSLAQKDEAEAAGHLSRLLFVSLASGVGMLFLTKVGAEPLLKAFVGSKNIALVPASRTYVEVRALAWPAVLVGMVAQSASLGMQDSWGPLKVLGIASLVNLVGDVLLCSFLGCGIAGAAWATMASQYVAMILMLKSLNEKGYNALLLTPPSWKELSHMVELAAPILLTMVSKVCFYILLTYLVTSLGAVTLAAHQVMIGIYALCAVWGEPLGQTAQSFMPALIHGYGRNLKQARMLLRSLVLIGGVLGLTLGCVATSVPWIFPHLFTNDPAIISQMRMVTAPLLANLVITPPLLSLEGTLLAGRDVKYLGVSTTVCFFVGSFLLVAFNRLGMGLAGNWWMLAAFQWARLLQSCLRLASRWSVLADPIIPTEPGFCVTATR